MWPTSCLPYQDIGNAPLIFHTFYRNKPLKPPSSASRDNTSPSDNCPPSNLSLPIQLMSHSQPCITHAMRTRALNNIFKPKLLYEFFHVST